MSSYRSPAWAAVSSRIATSYTTTTAGPGELGEPPAPAKDPSPPAALRRFAPRAQPTAAGNADGSRGEAAGTAGAEPAADLPEYCLGHLRSEDSLSPYGPTVRLYDLYPIEIPRPAYGRTTATIVCGTCGKGLPCTVSSRAQMRRDRRRRVAAWLALAVAGAGCCTAFAFLLMWMDDWHAPGPSPGLLFLLIIVVSVLVMCGVCKLATDGGVTGVKLADDGRHEMRRPGDTKSVEYPDGAAAA